MKVGDYIRTPFGITKCCNKYQIIIEEDLYETKYGYLYYLEDYDDEVCNITDSNLDEYKHSPNLINLIEVGDYVNGNKVTDINGNIYVKDVGYLEEIEIESIVTKEQFESMKYKVVE